MPLTPNQTLTLLNSLGHAPNKKLGQNFLIDGNIVRKSIELAEIGDQSPVVEIGPGLGTLSEAILATGADLYAVEKDAKLVAHLNDTLIKTHHNFDLIEMDCLKSPLGNCQHQAGSKPFKIVANLPYAVATPWLEMVLNTALPERMVLMLQKEAADRYSASPKTKNLGSISIFLQSAYEIHSCHNVSANCFFPKPKVDSTLIRLDKKETPVYYTSEVKAFIRRIFSQRRKQLFSLCKKDSFEGAEAWVETLIAKGTSSKVRAQEINLQSWQLLGHTQLDHPQNDHTNNDHTNNVSN